MPRTLRTRSLAALLVAPLVAPLLASSAAAQLPAAMDSALHTIFASGTYAPERFGPARWTSGDAYTTLERAPVGGGVELVEYAAATGARTVRVTAAQLTPPGGRPLAVADYAWSADGKRLLVFTNTRRVWRANTRGDYWVLDVPTGRLGRLGTAAPEASLMFAKFSPDGSRVAYVTGGDVYVERVDDRSVTRLTRDGSATLVNGISDWVYEEELDLRDAFRWSPDGRRIAFWQFDMTGVRDYTLINTTDSLYPTLTRFQYPKAGETNSAVRLGVVSADGTGSVTWAALPGDPRQHYLARAEWSSPDEIVVQQLDRLQQHDRVARVDARTGAVADVLVEHDSAWVDVVDDYTPLGNGREFLWLSERDGWRHAYAVDRARGTTRLLTPGAYDVIGVAAVAGDWLYVIASPDDATRRALYRVSLSKPGAPQRVSPADRPGTHGYSISPNGRWAIHTYSTASAPPVTDLVSLPDHKVVRTLVANDRLRAAAASLPAREFVRVPVGDGVTLDGWVMRPRTFAPNATYPVLVHVYGEPASQTVNDRWGGGQDLWHQAIADLGYVVVSFDNRGTPAAKGRAWRKSVYGAVGELASRDQAAALRALAAGRPWLDTTRVAVWGWSGGGSMTLNAMFRFPELYDVGMSVAPVPDQRLYDTIYQERYMGLPEQNAEGYRRGSPITFAEGLRGKLLLVHGSGDDNVHMQGTERLMNRLVSLGKQFDVMIYPNRSHCICEGAGTTLHVYTTLTRYLLDHLPPAAPAPRQ